MSESLSQWLVTQWTTRFGEILLTMGDVQPEMSVDTLKGALPADLIWWKQPFDLGPGGVIWTGVPAETQEITGNIVLTAAGVEKAPPSEIQSTYLELLRQSLSGLAQDIGNRLGGVVNCEAGAETAPDAQSPFTFQVKATITDSSVLFYVVIASALCEQILAEENAAESTPAQPKPNETPSSSFDSSAQSGPDTSVTRYSEHEPTSGSRTFDLLLDVELPVSISFGRATLRLNDALKLITGSLVELDRNLSDPVELLINNCVIARGEVVVIEGNYGIRLTEIISQKERLQQSRRFMLP
jgi:flagellar motor switch protein FliN/FliY